MAEQQPLFIPTESGEQPAASLHTRLHVRRTDPPSSAAAVPAPAKLARQAAWVLDLIATWGPGTPWELAHRAWAGGTTLGKENVTELYYAIDRRAKDLKVAAHIRVVGERECTIKAGGRTYQVLEVAR